MDVDVPNHSTEKKMSEEKLPTGSDMDGRADAGLAVRGLSKTFQSVEAVRDVGFEVESGAFCTILGPSGSGKTTVLRIIAGLERADEGEIWIGGKRVDGRRVHVPAQERQVGLVFQSYALWPHMTVFEHAAYPLETRRVGRQAIRERVGEILRMLRLDQHGDRYPFELSGGQQQRVAFARALASNPELLLLDEPLSNLDAELRREMQAELRSLHEKTGLTTVLVTHDQTEALALSDVIILMENGVIREFGPPAEVYHRPSSSRTAAFLGSANLLSATALGGGSPESQVRVRLTDGVEVDARARDVVEVGDVVTLAIKPEDVRVTSGRTEGPDSEANTFGLAVTSSTFLGSRVLLELESLQRSDGVEKALGDRPRLRAWSDSRSPLAGGEVVTVTLPSDRLLLFNEEMR